MNELTIVTAYYEFEKAKHSKEDYFNWIKNFMTINNYMVIFVNDEIQKNKIYNLRLDYLDKTKIIILPFEELYCYQFMDYWNKDYERDIEKQYHNQNLYIIWNEKTAFMKKAMDLNPFNTEFYCWSDIGMVRDDLILSYIKTFPSSKMLNLIDKTKVYLLNLKIFFKDINHYIGGGFIMCHKDMVDIWYDNYYSMLNEFMKKDLFAGKDQNIMNVIYDNFPKIIKLIEPIDPPFNHWFYMLFYFTDIYYNNYLHLQ